MFNRTVSELLHKYLSIFPVVGIMGPRQAGKTILAKSLLSKLDSGGLYLNMADERDVAKLKDPTTFFEYYKGQLIIIDEIRYHEELVSVIGKLVDRHKVPGKFLILGLASPHLLPEKFEDLKGKIGFLTIHPFNWLEIKGEVSMESHWLQGGLSGSLFAVDHDSRLSFLGEYIRNYVERDLPLLGLKADSQVILKFVKMIVECQGEIWNAKSYAKSLGISSPTSKKYLEYLESAFLVNVIKPFPANVGKRLVKAPKVYIRDTGILHYLLGHHEFKNLEQSEIFGTSWESYVICQIQSIVSKKFQLYFYSTHQGAYADLVLVKNGKPVMSLLMSLADEPAIPKGFNISINDLKTDQNFIVTRNAPRYHLTLNIEIIGITDLLLMLKNE